MKKYFLCVETDIGPKMAMCRGVSLEEAKNRAVQVVAMASKNVDRDFVNVGEPQHPMFVRSGLVRGVSVQHIESLPKEVAETMDEIRANAGEVDL